MTLKLEITAVSSRTVSLLILPNATRFHLDAPLDWVLSQADGTTVETGTTQQAPVFIEGLAPSVSYRFQVADQVLGFATPACSGEVDAAAFGLSEDAQDNSFALQSAIMATPAGGTLVLPKGVFKTRPIFLKADMTFYLPEGTCLFADHDRSGWPILEPRDETGRVVGTWEGLPEAAFAAPVTAIDCDNLVITGKGTLDGGGDRGDWWDWPKETRDGARRPRGLFLAYGKNVQLSGFTIQNTPSWTVHPFHIDGLTCVGLKIINPADSPNTDGLNPESCTDIDLAGIHFTVGDDCIAVKAGKRGPGQVDHLAPTRRLTVRHCFMERGHGGVVLGSEMSGEITDVAVHACEFLGTDRGLRIKTRRGRGGKVARVSFRDVVMRDVPTPFAINAFYFCDPDGHDDWVQDRAPAAVDDTTPEVHDITLEQVTATGVAIAGVAVLGLPERPVHSITIKDFNISFDSDAAPGVPLMADGVAPVRNVAIWSEFAEIDGTVDLIPHA
ncbi:glycoside hydrolase family 28 protein [Tropicibacter sp. R15_0]|uniref:polygalacturonase PglA n=1 Tax=Tropicibacter sp. R15_0 TaxID=2821101 RepID=UPI001ADCC22F|nr:glycoside hydrolase family 28 protein [Tropicibacter sp. R15_0]MBO9467683.1 glycoside hydrolase family 28 protein [Tropicibacter sp. R15_0]